MESDGTAFLFGQDEGASGSDVQTRTTVMCFVLFAAAPKDGWGEAFFGSHLGSSLYWEIILHGYLMFMHIV